MLMNDVSIDGREYSLVMITSAVVFCVGLVFPIYESSLPLVSGLNLIWGTLFGLGWYFSLALHLPRLLEGVIGFFLWPGIVMVCVFRLSRWASVSKGRALAWILCLAATLVATVPRPDFTDRSLGSTLPTFQKFVRAAY